jgi:hypothetical protein
MCATVAEIMNGNWKNYIISKFKRDNFVKNHQTITKFKLDLIIPLKYIYMHFEPYTNFWRAETENFIKTDSSVENHCTMTKFGLDLHITLKYVHMQFEHYTCIQTNV